MDREIQRMYLTAFAFVYIIMGMINVWGNIPCSVAGGSLIQLTCQREGERATRSCSESPHQERSKVTEGFSAWVANRHNIHWKLKPEKFR